jgi:hypothetical protein
MNDNSTPVLSNAQGYILSAAEELGPIPNAQRETRNPEHNPVRFVPQNKSHVQPEADST